MNTMNSLYHRLKTWFDRFPEAFLLLGILLMTFAHLTYDFAFLAWFCMLPFLYYLKFVNARYKLLKFVLALFVSWSLIVLKIITPPIPFVLIFMYSVPITLVHLPAYILWYKADIKGWRMFLFPAALLVLEWLQFTFTPLGSWGSLAYTQSEQLVLLQSLSLVGMPGLTLLIASANVWLLMLLRKDAIGIRWGVWVPVVFVLVLIYGEQRVDRYQSVGKRMIKVAAVGTDSEAGGLPLPSESRNRRDFFEILKRSRLASEAGARVIVWTEAAFITQPAYEGQWIDSMCRVAREGQSTLFASYVNVVSLDPLRYENKYQLINSKGEVVRSYHKHMPVPGEPAEKGKELLQVSKLGDTRVGGAICYDYDFPYLARAYGQLGADLVALPSSDWRGIDPLHTRMAAFRAIEQGHSIVRSTRFGLSAAIDPTGRVLAQQSSYDTTNKVMLADLPAKGVVTLYSRLGDAVVWLSLLYLIGVISLGIYARSNRFDKD